MLILPYILAAIAMIAILDLFSLARTRRAAQRQAARLFAHASGEAVPLPSPEELDRYPELLRRYLNKTGILKRAPVRTVRMRQKGAIRFRPKQAWKPFEAKCFLASQDLAEMVWFADVTMGLLHSRTLLHNFLDGQPMREARSWGTLVLRRFSDRTRIRQHLLLEYCAAAVWHPDAWLFPGLQWETVPGGLRASTSDPENVLELLLRFGKDDLLEELAATLGETSWIYRYSDYQTFHDMCIPMHWTVEIRQQNQTWTHLEGQVTDVAVNGEFGWW